MTKKMLAGLAAVVVLVATATAFLAYRMGVRHGQGAQVADAAPAAAGSERSACLDIHDAPAHSGENNCVAGRVLRVYTSRAGNAFLDFCSDYRSCPFTSVIFSSDTKKFGNLQSLSGRRVEIHGEITSYQNKPEIIIRDPEQIRAMD